MATTAEDIALTYLVIAQPAPGNFFTDLYSRRTRKLQESSGSNIVHSYQLPPAPHIAHFNEVDDLSDVRLGIYPQWFNDSVPAVRDACWAAVLHLKSRGVQLVDIDIPHLNWLSLAHGIKVSTEFASTWDATLHTRSAAMEPNTRVLVSIGSSITALESLSAEKLRAWAADYLHSLFMDLNLTAIVNPTAGILPPKMSANVKTHGESNTALVMQLMKYVFLANLVGQPGYSVPIDYSREQSEYLPIGLHLQGNHWEEHKLMRIAHALEIHYPKAKASARPLPQHHFDPFSENE
jgi:Asp-tRNA(Asn)/Glu-tRNA(Gln) amidotransferase A subunit family amidase